MHGEPAGIASELGQGALERFDDADPLRLLPEVLGQSLEPPLSHVVFGPQPLAVRQTRAGVDPLTVEGQDRLDLGDAPEDEREPADPDVVRVDGNDRRVGRDIMARQALQPRDQSIDSACGCTALG